MPGPKSPQIHRQEWQQKHNERLGSAVHSSADPAQHYCLRHASDDPRSQPIHRQGWPQRRGQTLGSDDVVDVDADALDPQTTPLEAAKRILSC